jgi:adenosylcobinamide-phosphate synthase
MIESLLVILFALGLDLVAGDPASRYHPTAWIGRFIGRLTILFKTDSTKSERIGGVFLVLIPCVVITSIMVAIDISLNLLSDNLILLIASVVIWSILLKSTIAIKGMERHALGVLEAINRNDEGIKSARDQLSMIVKRPTKHLDKKHVISGTVESVAENTVDGITGPLFYFAFFSIPGAFVYRIINTIDSMVGYKTWMFANLGWFGANCDKILNYVPSRLTGVMMVLGSAILGYNWRNSWHVMLRDARTLQSPNAGYPMAALAGALQISLEKVGHYKIGDDYNTKDDTQQEDNPQVYIIQAIKLMKTSSILFCGMVTVPIVVALSYLGWWIHV